MRSAPTETELQEFFEQVWQLAEETAAADDVCIAVRLFELADEIAEWRNQIRAGSAALGC